MRAAVTLEEQRGDILGQIVRFDDAHGRFHRHKPGWPEPGSIIEFLDHVETRRRAAYARQQMLCRYAICHITNLDAGQGRIQCSA